MIDSQRQGMVGAMVLGLYTESPLHPGSGQSTGIVDLPVQRERHTNFPLMQASGVKGSFRDVAENRWGTGGVVDVLFGAQVGQGLTAGAVVFTDAHILAFPVRSLSNIFLWVTCPLVLARLARDLRLAGLQPQHSLLQALNSWSLENGQMIAGQNLGTSVVLEDLSFAVNVVPRWREAAAQLSAFLPSGPAHEAYRAKFLRDVVLVSNDDFSYLVQYATQVSARIALNDETKTTSGEGGNLWYEETIPPDTLFTLLVAPQQPRGTAVGEVTDAAAARQRMENLVQGEPFFMQFGGNETVGQGWCAVKLAVNNGNINT